MRFFGLIKEPGAARGVSNIYDAIDRGERSLSDIPFMTGSQFRATQSGAGTLVIRHGLRRRPLGWMTLSVYAASEIYEVARDSETVTFGTTSGFNADVWIY